jgi:uncharacterized protein (TIGR02266 family)
MSAEKGTADRDMNRRTEGRISVNREFASAEEFLAEYVANVSRSGAFIRTDDPLPVGTKVALRFTVILDELETIEGVGMVVRRLPPGGGAPAGMGVVFTELTAYSKQLLEKIITRR